jgi:hypothetical protein
MLKVPRRFVLLLAVLAASASPLIASPVAPGTLTPIQLEGGGTISGYFTFDAALTAIADWNIVVSGGTFDGQTFSGETLTTANSQVTYNREFLYGGNTYSTIDVRNLDYPNTAGTSAITLVFAQMPTAIPAGGLALALCSAATPCTDPPLGFNIYSGEFESAPTASNPFGYISRNVTGGYLTISDPPASVSLNFSLDPVLIPVEGGDGGDNGTTVPEPATLSLIGLGAVLAMGSQRNRRKRSSEV